MKQAAKTFLVAVAGAWICAASAGAFPTWIGAYGLYPRHSGANPGQFTILMNEDYYGLEANVGIRVNGGGWTEYPMSYATNASGNSVWTYAPAEPFPFGAEVEFYFHGYEGANHIYASAGGSNYFSGPLFWSEPADTGLVSAYPGNGYGKARICALGGDLIGGHSYGVLTLARKPVGCEWEALEYPLEDVGIVDFGIAGNGDALVVAFMTGTNVAVRTSADRGETFSAPVQLAAVPANGSFSGLSVSAGAAGEFGVAYGVATNCCGAQQIFFARSADGGSTWSAPVEATASGDPGAYFSWQELGHNDDGWFLAARNVWGGSSLLMYCAHSTDGAAWTTSNLGGNRAWGDSDLCLSSNVAAIAADPYYDDFIRVFRCQGGSWSTQDVARALEGGRAVRLSHDGHGEWFLFRQVDNNAGWLWGSFLSRDDGYAWTTNRAMPNPTPMNASSDSFTLEQVLNVGPKQYALWHADYYVGTYQRMHEALLQKSDGYEERLDELTWTGNAFTIAIANAAPGATNHLECSADIVDPVWTNLYTWTGRAPATNWSGTLGTQGYFRVRIDR